MKKLVMLMPLIFSLGCGTAAPASVKAPVEAVSLDGRALPRITLPPGIESERLAELAEAKRVLAANPDDPDALIWVGRRTAYLGRYREAIEIFSRGIRRFPDDARFLRHRGHRFISIRNLDRAIEDLRKAADLIEGEPDQIEPDGLPNARGIPTSSLQSNIWYHLGLAHYLTGDFESALKAYRSGMAVSNNPDGLVSMSYWLYLTLRRLGREVEAEEVLKPIHPDLDVIENQSYHRLLLMNRGDLEPGDLRGRNDDALQDVTIDYGVGSWHLYNGRKEDATTVFERIIASGEWPAFGYIAAEAELARR